MLNIDLQHFGGRGSSSGGGGGGGVGNNDIISSTSLISERESKRREVDQTLKVAKYVQDTYGVNVYDMQIATLKPKAASTMAFYSSSDTLTFNTAYFDSKTINAAYDKSIKSGFHPSRGKESGIAAVAAHEMGHKLTNEAGKRQGMGDWSVDRAAASIVKQAARNAGYGNKSLQFASKVSGYAKQKGYSEAVAEAFSDVFCNGKRASRESTAIVNVLNSYLGR